MNARYTDNSITDANMTMDDFEKAGYKIKQNITSVRR